MILPLALDETDQAAHQDELALLEGASHAAQVAVVVTKLKCRFMSHLEMSARLNNAGVDRDMRGRPKASDHAPGRIVLGSGLIANK
ncbi:hypothetical protein [Paracoccus alcaliphilus]|uniref:hypothetical protein n=1 Tax=Paracoccus alcaliphilus TaxID=34002 RepID=UPI001113D4A4|nr:hypothetical protein [Paracoccus alcaliphilus]WCR21081.1 hypothetical protein JHW40_23515 [Paracoccus alcaliphilus]